MAQQEQVQRAGRPPAASDHPLFRRHPLSGEATISTGAVPVPYHVYDGQGLLIAGTADFSRAAALLADQSVRPMQTTAGRALIAVWALDFTAASLGPHKELQLSILASRGPAAALPDHPLALLQALLFEPAARMFCYRLWNDTETAVAYNRELLGLDARLAEADIAGQDGTFRFRFRDDRGQPLSTGQVRLGARPSLRVGWSLVRLLGLRETLRSLSQGILEATFVNPTGVRFADNLDAQTFVAPDTPVVQFFDEKRDVLTLSDPDAAAFAFRPQFVEHFAPFRFVYLTPNPATG